MPPRADLAKLDRKRAGKGSNKQWEHPDDPDVRITKMKDGRPYLAHKVEHAVDMKRGTMLTVQQADRGDTQTIEETTSDRKLTLCDDFFRELVTDKGYHSNDTITVFRDVGVRTYSSEPNRGRRNWKNTIVENEAVYANRRRTRGECAKPMLRQRGLMMERPFAHTLEPGGM